MFISKLTQAMIFGGLLATTITLNAFAFDLQEVQTGETPYLNAFQQLDANHNGQLTWAELQKDSAAKPATFKAYDQNADSHLSYQEYAEMKTHISQQAIKGAMSDSWITTKVKAKLLEETAFKSFNISVETHQGDVIISGFVNDATLRSKAEQLVAGIEGVKSVKNAIVVKS